MVFRRKNVGPPNVTIKFEGLCKISWLAWINLSLFGLDALLLLGSVQSYRAFAQLHH